MGTIYEIICWTTGRRYIGKKIHSLGTRLKNHKSEFKLKTSNNSAFLVLEHGNYEMYELEKIEDKNELLKKEKYYIQHTDCVNVAGIGYRSFEVKKYEKENEDELKKYQQTWYEANKERIKKKHEERYTCNCGSNIYLYQKSIHIKSKKHQNYLANL